MADVPEAIAIRELLERLTPRQRAVCLLLAEGRSQVDAAQRLGITPQSVQYHLKRIRNVLSDMGFDIAALRPKHTKASRRRRRGRA